MQLIYACIKRSPSQKAATEVWYSLKLALAIARCLLPTILAVQGCIGCKCCFFMGTAASITCHTCPVHRPRSFACRCAPYTQPERQAPSDVRNGILQGRGRPLQEGRGAIMQPPLLQGLQGIQKHGGGSVLQARSALCAWHSLQTPPRAPRTRSAGFSRMGCARCARGRDAQAPTACFLGERGAVCCCG